MSDVGSENHGDDALKAARNAFFYCSSWLFTHITIHRLQHQHPDMKTPNIKTSFRVQYVQQQDDFRTSVDPRGSPGQNSGGQKTQRKLSLVGNKWRNVDEASPLFRHRNQLFPRFIASSEKINLEKRFLIHIWEYSAAWIQMNLRWCETLPSRPAASKRNQIKNRFIEQLKTYKKRKMEQSLCRHGVGHSKQPIRTQHRSDRNQQKRT